MWSMNMLVCNALGSENLLLNPNFEFHAFDNHRHGKDNSHTSHNVAFWNTDKWGDITVMRESHVPNEIRPDFSTHNIVSIRPGKKFQQFFALPEVGLAHGDYVNLYVNGYQKTPGAIKATIKIMKLDSEDGTWEPTSFGMKDKRTFSKHSRGELVVAAKYEVSSSDIGTIALEIEDAKVLGQVNENDNSSSVNINAIGIVIEFTNTSTQADVYVYSPSLTKKTKAVARNYSSREMVPYYCSIPRTIQKLWKGQAVHIMVMGSSIDRGSANPQMYLYDENPSSNTFKEPIAQGEFDPNLIDRPELNGYYGYWQHYFSYTGRLRLELMRKFNLPVSKICLNFMAVDGSCVGEAHSGLKEYCSLSIPPSEADNGHKAGTTWKQLYPGLFSRPEGPRPDLIIFGSGANEKTDTPDEVAVFEGMIRWIQRNYPNTEFLFSQFQNFGGYTSNPGDMQAISLRYQIPFLDYGKIGDDVVRWCNRYSLVPKDGHPQAAAHYIWFKQIEKAFECWDPILPGKAQLQLPERIHHNSYGWEGDMTLYKASDSERINGNKFIFDDTVINCWADVDCGQPMAYVDGARINLKRKFPKHDIRNSMSRYGRCRLGDRHILEVDGEGAELTYVDAKNCPDKLFLGVDSPRWNFEPDKIIDFVSKWGSPYGSKQMVMQPGSAIEIDVVCTDVSVAYVDSLKGGTLQVFIDGEEKLSMPTNIPFVDIKKNKEYMENRKGILNLGFGVHHIRIEASDAEVAFLGIFTYDSRSNRDFERQLVGYATAGQTIPFSLPFKNRPFVICSDSLKIEFKDIQKDRLIFSGVGSGMYQVIGQ